MPDPAADGEAEERARLLSLLSENGFAPERAATLLGAEFSVLARTIPQLVWRSRDLGRWTWASRQWRAFTAQPGDAPLGTGWLDCVHPDDRARTREAWGSAQDAGRLEVLHRIACAPGGGYRWFETRAAPYVFPDGRREWFGTCTDVDDLRRSLARQADLLAELQHRVRNLLGTLRGLVRRSACVDGAPDSPGAKLDARLAALMRLQAHVTRDPFARVSLAELLTEAVAGVLGPRPADVVISGPGASLSPRAAETLSLAFHELAANALSHGALGRGNPLRVGWLIAHGAAPSLTLVWRESNPGTIPPRREGLGLEVLRSRIPYELGASAELSFPDDGFRARIEFPLGEDVAEDADASGPSSAEAARLGIG